MRRYRWLYMHGTRNIAQRNCVRCAFCVAVYGGWVIDCDLYAVHVAGVDVCVCVALAVHLAQRPELHPVTKEVVRSGLADIACHYPQVKHR